MALRVTVLGCGGSTGVPLLGGPDGRGAWGACDPGHPHNRRTRSSIWLERIENEELTTSLLVDTGPDLRAQALACGIPRVDGVVYTHAHADHIIGLDELRVFNRISQAAIPAYGTATTLEEISRRFDYAFRPPTPPAFFRPALEARPVTAGDEIRVGALSLRSFAQDHHVTQTLGLRAGGFAYSTDVVRLDDAAFAALAGVEVWLLGCFQREPHSTHAHLDLALAWHARLQPRLTVLTHLGPDLDYPSISRQLPGDVRLAHDGMRLELA